MTNFAFPYQFDGGGRTTLADDDRHIRDLIEQTLFTTPGERINRPNFGAALSQLVFAPNSPELATATQFLVQGALQQWLGDLIVVQQVDVSAEDSTLTVVVKYAVRRTQEIKTATFATGGGL
ncbi:GPW/gp25 family protein [Methylocapsa polymorpha]|uniref:GPW/gp25 family protein n=1 Tax=Methylocapsa polymorpha TaxID=3080828 RepID=A0ABZ0HX23_9HYPH|nr:GPW/gp25 family protein [Methylocapsa sp. RX1]